MTRSFILSFAAVAALAVVGQAQAQTNRVEEGYSHDPAVNIHYMSVRYADLDLSSAAGRNALYSRIEAAADRVCGPHPAQNADRVEREDYLNCRETTIAQTMTLVSGPERVAMAALAKRRASEFAMLP